MQVSVCHLRTRGGRFQGLTAFRKNIFSFPQELVEMKTLHQFFDTLAINDVVNVVMEIDETTGRLDERCARLMERGAEGGWLARVDGEDELVHVTTQHITTRVKLPWKPTDVRDYFIVFRRRDAEKDTYIEDNEVRRHLAQGALRLLTTIDEWRPDTPAGPPCTNTTPALILLLRKSLRRCFPKPKASLRA